MDLFLGQKENDKPARLLETATMGTAHCPGVEARALTRESTLPMPWEFRRKCSEICNADSGVAVRFYLDWLFRKDLGFPVTRCMLKLLYPKMSRGPVSLQPKPREPEEAGAINRAVKEAGPAHTGSRPLPAGAGHHGHPAMPRMAHTLHSQTSYGH